MPRFHASKSTSEGFASVCGSMQLRAPGLVKLLGRCGKSYHFNVIALPSISTYFAQCLRRRIEARPQPVERLVYLLERIYDTLPFGRGMRSLQDTLRNNAQREPTLRKTQMLVNRRLLNPATLSILAICTYEFNRYLPPPPYLSLLAMRFSKLNEIATPPCRNGTCRGIP